MIDKLHVVVQAQYFELERALVGMRDFVLVDEYKKYWAPSHIWSLYDNEKRKKHFMKFMKANKTKFVTSSTGLNLISVIQQRNGGEKPNQSKRKRATKTFTPRRVR